MPQTSEKLSLSTNVYIVAENRLLRESLARLFRKRSDLSVVGEGSYPDSTTERINSLQPDLILLDCVGPEHKPELICDLRGSMPEIRVVLFWVDDDAEVFLSKVGVGGE